MRMCSSARFSVWRRTFSAFYLQPMLAIWLNVLFTNKCGNVFSENREMAKRVENCFFLLILLKWFQLLLNFASLYEMTPYK